jgi:hypothetical protein
MAINKSAIFVEKPQLWTAALTSQTLTRDGVTGAGVLLGTASESGFLVYSVQLADGTDVKVDAGNGTILHTEAAGTDNEADQGANEGEND